jgi:hypothetical protein
MVHASVRAVGEVAGGAQVGKATTYILSARELFDFALPLMKAVAADSRAAERLKELSGRGGAPLLSGRM